MQNISVSDQATDDGWETTSTASTHSTPTSKLNPPSSASPVRSSHHKQAASSKQPSATAPKPTPPAAQASRQSVLDQYWIERAKFIKHLEKRSKKFAKRSKEDYDAARWGKEKPRPIKKAASHPKAAVPPKQAPLAPVLPPPLPPRPSQKTAASPPASPGSTAVSTEPDNMIASTSKAVARVAKVG